MVEPIIKRLITSGKDGVDNMVTILEDEADRHILLRALQAGDGIHLQIVDRDGRNNTQDRVIRISSTAELLVGPPGPAGPAGDSVTIVNQGNGEELFINKTGVDLNLKTLVAGTGVRLTPTAQTIVIETLGDSGGVVDVNHGGTGKTSIADNAVIVGSEGGYVEKAPTYTHEVLTYDGVSVGWQRSFIPLVFNITFNSSQQIDSVISPTGVVCNILGPNSFSFNNPFPTMIPYSSQALGLNSSNRWVSRQLSNTFRYEYDTPSIITIVGCSSSAMGTTSPGSGKLLFTMHEI